MDGIVRAAYESVSDGVGAASRIALVATGGYGRGTMAPGSDVDLLLLMPEKHDGAVESVIEAMLYVLWDLKLKVGHATRTVSDCIREARLDMTTRTALLETRFLLGDRSLFDELESRFAKEVIKGSAAVFVQAKLQERETRVRRAGESRYLVEPNVKDGKGGLRDLNTLLWIMKYVYRISSPADLVRDGLFTAEEADGFNRCEEFLWRVRCHLHFATGRAEERLSFENQRIVSQRLGVTPRRGQEAVERFMKAYFRVAKEVGDLTAIVCAGLETRHGKRKPVLDRVFRPFRRRRKLEDSPDFTIDTDRITVRADDVFERDPVNLVRLFAIADRHNLPIHPHARRLASRSTRLIGPRIRRDPEANRYPGDSDLAWRARNILRRMNEAESLADSSRISAASSR
jgi:[protein-PII] uridylyltransferase